MKPFFPRIAKKDIILPPGVDPKHMCIGCAKCCRYVCVEIDAPDCREDFEDLRWMVAHEGLSIHVNKKTWELMIQTTCTHLQSNGLCGVYETRPQVCRDHIPGECDTEVEVETDYGADYLFTSMKEIEIYRDKHFPLNIKKKKKTSKTKKKKLRKKV
ncbi:MAG: hypothetical protein COX62_01485 [Deltaproteobacteria bacterium CG_4_10_14_0_2_um_filter_43_8]|nr:MAG: hypothetical protein COV43_00520 [Deltaproteobacteria bacterium CG11_big_fil_rev_8_21_14_0_20_42_23]PJA21760.1 MAG: hypothetical protein COX62_01485 [Deltaproteobacteria bacterium CG_4_10_14_0_2_um_filter_43_8]PJC63852.1 MAG: hypothetical protein CO021_07310 [Deltaproteobacteria bacterium CG_4_9_14_0_2_um_filter_42_21]